MDAQRFLEAQERMWPLALRELRRGQKDSHWMWFVFPQHVALGRSPTAKQFGLAGREDARAYLAHPVLGARLLEAVAAAVDSPAETAEALFGRIDMLKFRSCLTLFAAAADDPAPFETALARFHGGDPDPETLRLIAR